MVSVKGWVLATAASAAVLLGAGGTASAMTVCANGGSPETKCGVGKGEYTGNVSMSGSVSITTNVTTVNCQSQATFKLPESTGAIWLPMEVTALSLTSCKTGSGTACEVTVKNLPYPGSIVGPTFTVQDSTGMAFQTKCGFLVNCEFSSKEAAFEMTNGSPSTVWGSGIKLTRSGGFCPEIAELDASYSVTSPAGFTILTWW